MFLVYKVTFISRDGTMSNEEELSAQHGSFQWGARHSIGKSLDTQSQFMEKGQNETEEV